MSSTKLKAAPAAERVERMPEAGYLTRDDVEIGNEFLTKGAVIRAVEDRAALDRIQSEAANLAAKHLKLPAPSDPGRFLNEIGTHTDAERLNALRIAVMDGLNTQPWFRQAYFALARGLLGAIVGNELVMQRRVNLSIQLPDDASSLLPVHADVWSGDSPFEVVVWLPLVDCYRTKAMYLTPPHEDARVQGKLREFNGRSSEDLYAAIEGFVDFIEIAYGQVMCFNHNLMHGNRVNREPESRWSMNCRFKSLFSPYADKKLGEFFEPITLKPATRFAMRHALPGGFEE